MIKLISKKEYAIFIGLWGLAIVGLIYDYYNYKNINNLFLMFNPNLATDNISLYLYGMVFIGYGMHLTKALLIQRKTKNTAYKKIKCYSPLFRRLIILLLISLNIVFLLLLSNNPSYIIFGFLLLSSSSLFLQFLLMNIYISEENLVADDRQYAINEIEKMIEWNRTSFYIVVHNEKHKIYCGTHKVKVDLVDKLDCKNKG